MGDRASSVLGRTAEVLHREGLAGLRIRALDATVYRRLVISSREAGERIADVPALAPGTELAFLRTRDLGAYAAFRPDAEPAETERRLRSGHRFLAAWEEGRILHGRWISTDRLESAYLGLAFDLPRGSAYVYDTFTAEAARRRGLTIVSGTRVAELLSAEGFETILGSVWPGNVPGRAMLRANRQELIGSIGSIRLGPLRIPVMHSMPEGFLGAARRFRPADEAR